ncbi:hypothetical protein SLS62_004416 [Diatrype stigma]|uniref:Flavin-nucleotide-binding protein n=1 Tax=Diatrype stigma TaxID=117547 RepID=A0AAN9YP84_9PEZI
MPSHNLEYPKQPYSTVNRYGHRASYSLETIHQIINTCPVLHVSFAAEAPGPGSSSDPDSAFPAILPMIGQMGSFARPSADVGDVLDLYLHGYVSSRMVNRARSAGAESEGEGNDKKKGLPLTVAATHVDGLVLSLTPYSHSYNYRSAVLFGHAEVVTGPAEKLWAMELITNSVVRDRWRHTRVPPTGAEMQSTSILRVAIAGGSAKVQRSPPSDAKADLADAELTARVWTGIVPLHLTAAEPVPIPAGNGGDAKKVPPYLREYVDGLNQSAREMALEVAEGG